MMTHKEETRDFLGDEDNDPVCPHCEPNPCMCLYENETEIIFDEEDEA